MKEKSVSLKTKVPGPKSSSVQEVRQKHLPKGIGSLAPFYIKEGKGSLIKDLDDNVFIDFSSGIGVNVLGHSHDEMVEAVKSQAEKYFHTCAMVVMYESYVRLAEKLNEVAPGDTPKKSIFFNSGAEAVENAVKIARRYTGKNGVASIEFGYHGRTLLTMTLTSKVRPFKFGYGPFAPEVYKLPAPYCYRCKLGLNYPECKVACADYLEKFFVLECPHESLGAIVVEPILGEGGFITPPPEYFHKLRELCDKYGLLLIMDEIQTGFGRTGKLFATEHSGVEPDIIAVAKAMAGGMPISGLVGKADVMNVPDPGELGGTYGGNPLACEAALKVIEVIEKEGLVERANQLGDATKKRFEQMKEKYSIIGDVRGVGAMVAMELVKDRESKEFNPEAAGAIVKECYENGLLVLKAGAFNNVVRTLMPLVTTDEQLKDGLDILEKAVEKVQKDLG